MCFKIFCHILFQNMLQTQEKKSNAKIYTFHDFLSSKVNISFLYFVKIRKKMQRFSFAREKKRTLTTTEIKYIVYLLGSHLNITPDWYTGIS